MDEEIKWMLAIRVAERIDGGMRVWSDEMPGLILSGPDPAKVGADILPAIRALRQHQDQQEIMRINNELREIALKARKHVSPALRARIDAAVKP